MVPTMAARGPAEGFEVLPRPRVIEGSFAWPCRRLRKELRAAEASTAMLAVAIIQFLLWRLVNA